MSSESIHITIMTCSYLGAAAGGISGLILGILMLIPAAPFDQQMLTAGVVLVTLSALGLVSLVGAIGGAVIGVILYGLALLITGCFQICFGEEAVTECYNSVA